MRKKVLCFN